MYRGKLLAIIGICAVIGTSVYFYSQNLPKYDWAVVQGTVNSVYQTKQGWYYNVSLVKGTDGNLSKVEPLNVNNVHPSPYPDKQNGFWVYVFRQSCDLFKPGDPVYLKTAIQDKYLGFPNGVLGYWLDGDGSELAPSFMQEHGIGFVQVVGC